MYRRPKNANQGNLSVAVCIDADKTDFIQINFSVGSHRTIAGFHTADLNEAKALLDEQS